METTDESKLNQSARPEEELSTMRLQGTGIGVRPGGLSAALYAARAELSPVVLTGMELGGQAALTHTIENYPGFPEGVGGAQLGELFQKQAERFGAVVEYERPPRLICPASPSRCTDLRAGIPGGDPDHRDRGQPQPPECAGRDRIDRPRRFLLRHLRWLVFQG